MNRIAVNRDMKKNSNEEHQKIAAHQTSHDPLFGLWGHASKSRQLPLSQPGWEKPTVWVGERLGCR